MCKLLLHTPKHAPAPIIKFGCLDFKFYATHNLAGTTTTTTTRLCILFLNFYVLILSVCIDSDNTRYAEPTTTTTTC